jgi:hypothetical protein
MTKLLTNGARMQATITVAMAMFSIGVLWHRISANAAAMRETMQQIRIEQGEIKKQLEAMTHKP